MQMFNFFAVFIVDTCQIGVYFLDSFAKTRAILRKAMIFESAIITR